MTPTYSASLSQSQGRTGFSIIFRHPVRPDPATGKAGLRVRKGLGTRDPEEAEVLRAQLNELLAERRFHNPAARADAERRFDSRVVEIFYYQMTPEEVDFRALRDDLLELPPTEPNGYRQVQLLGTTGAGKTTVVRQLIGTDPKQERFPSTSPAKTTVHDTEIILREGPWKAVVTFTPEEEVREYLGECVSSAVLAASRGASDSTLMNKLLNHVNQRFRFSYVLGTGLPEGQEVFEEDDDADPLDELEVEPELDLSETNAVLAEALTKIRGLAAEYSTKVREQLGVRTRDDERVAEEVFEEELDSLLRDDDGFYSITDSLMDEIAKRFDGLPAGTLSKTKQGWPLSWVGEWPEQGRSDCLRALNMFSSNYAPRFGSLLTPLVNGVRVAGPFRPAWSENVPKLVLFDGEGLGHTARSSSSVSTSVSRRIDAVDAVLLIDNAAQPMQAASLAAMREIVSSGHSRKLLIAFTHFDDVQGDNLGSSRRARVRHVMASADNVLSSFGQDLGPFAERALRKRFDEATFFLEDAHRVLDPEDRSGRRTIEEFRRLTQAIDRVIAKPDPVASRPVYDRSNLVLAVRAAAEAFQGAWRSILGLEVSPGFPKEHWTRLKALSRRLATGMADEYDTLQPVADLRKELQKRLYVSIQNPLRWEGPEPTDDEKQALFDSLADNLAGRLLLLATLRVRTQRVAEWQQAYSQQGIGSTFVRARVIGDDIYARAAPVPDVTPSPDRNQFMRDVIAEVEAAASELGCGIE